MTPAPADIDAARALATELKRRWRKGEAPDAAAALADHPSLARNKSVVIDLAYEEYLLREQAGDAPDPGSFADRFPAFRGSIRGAIDAHRLLTEQPELLDPAAGEWPAAGEQFEGLELLAELGRGAFGHVYLAFDPGVNRLVALKLTTGRSAEARVIGQLDHPHVTDVYWARVLGARTAVCMPFVGVSTLTDVISAAFPHPGDPAPALADVILRAAETDDLTGRVTRRPPAAVTAGEPYLVGACAVAARVADAVAYLHRKGVAHGDLKPSNVVVGPGGAPHLIDFNLSADESAPPAARGTPAYMAPEVMDAVLTGAPVTAAQSMRADLFSLGVVVYELLTGRLPFAPAGGKPDLAALAAAARVGRPELPAGLPAKAAAVMAACLSTDPARRPADAAAVAAALDRVVLAHRDRGPRRRRRLMAAAGVALLGAVVTTAVLVWPRPPVPPIAPEPSSPPTAEDFFSRGRAALQTSDLPAARADFEAAYARSGDPKHLAYLAYTLARIGEPDKSAEVAARAIAGGAKTAEVYNNYGYVLSRISRADDAKAAIAEALRLDPTLPAAKYNGAMITFQTDIGAGRLVDLRAAADMKAVVERGLSSADLHLDAARVFTVCFPRDETLKPLVFEQVAAAIRAGRDPVRVANDGFLSVRLAGQPEFQAALKTPQGVPPPVAPQLRLVSPTF